MNDLVSVVIPVYKVEAYIERTLRSVVAQTFKNIEIILVDDGTPDNSIGVAEALLKGEGVNWRVIHQPNSGLPTARNNGIAASKGEWVICIDSDDYIAPQTIERMMDAAEETNCDCVFCGFKNVYDANFDAQPQHEGGCTIYEMEPFRRMFLNRELIVLVPGMLLKHSIYDKVKFDKDCPHDEDIHFMWRLFYTIDRMAYIDADYYNYYLRSTSMSHTLKPAAYLKTAERYKEMETELTSRFPNDKVIPMIYPKYRLGGLHVLAKSTDYKTFKETVIKDGYRNDMSRLIFQPNMKLSMYALLYCISLPLFYRISK